MPCTRATAFFPRTRAGEICAERGIALHRPVGEVIRRMGDKTAAAGHDEAGVPVMPGTEGNLSSMEEALAEADRIGYPVMLKATSGGGGRGIRRCNSAQELEQNYHRVVSEATKAFGSAEVFLEKCIVIPDTSKRRCWATAMAMSCICSSATAPSSAATRSSSRSRHRRRPTPEQRADIGDLSVRAAKAVGYENAGTVEFLLDRGRFYFMEMNTRVQVEHTVTEEITGIDIVREQIRIADGLPLRATGRDSERGFAMEFRINAEDPKNDFLPSFGRITRYYAPGGPGVRTDGASTPANHSPLYDSMCLKLMVWALTWRSAMARPARAAATWRLMA